MHTCKVNKSHFRCFFFVSGFQAGVYFEGTNFPELDTIRSTRLGDRSPESGPLLELRLVPSSKMEALGGYPTRSSNPKAKKLTVLLSMTVGVGCLFLLQTQLLKPRKPVDFYTFEVKDAKGRTILLEKYRGKVGPHHRLVKLCFNRGRTAKVDHLLRKKCVVRLFEGLRFIRRRDVSQSLHCPASAAVCRRLWL